MTRIFTGDDVNFAVQLTKSDVAFNIPTDATVTAVIREDDYALSSIENCYSNAAGANWAA